jgi:hypothetical protein
MVEEFERRYGMTGVVLYPSRETGGPTFRGNPIPSPEARPFTVAYAGTLHTVDCIRQLAVVGRILRQLDGTLLLFGPHSVEDLSARGLDTQNVRAGGLLNSDELIRCLRVEADVLFLPMSFAPADSGAFALNFPSKLTDYTAAGLPILIWGPKESSAVKWTMMEPGVAAVVTDPSELAMSKIIDRLKNDLDWRHSLGLAAVEAGQRYFSPDCAQATLYESLHRLAEPGPARGV